MLRGRGFLGFLVSWFLGSLVSWLLVPWFSGSWFLGFLVSKFLGLLVSKFQSSKDSMIPYYQTSISCFLENIDPISKIFKQYLDGYSCFFGHPSFPIFFNRFDFHFLRFVDNDCCENYSLFFLAYLTYPGVSKDK